MYKSKITLIISLLLVLVLSLTAACASKTTTATVTTTAISTTTAAAAAAQTVTSTKPVTQTATVTQATTVTATAQSSDTPQYGGTLRVIWSNSPASGFGWGPKIFGGEGFPADPAMEPLLDGKFLGGYENRLATDYKVASDGTITFTLRKGVKFHDGTDFNADAVKFNIDAMIKAGKYGKEVLSCDVADPNTVKIKVSEFKNTTLSTVAGTVMASPTAVKAHGEDWAAINAVGTGPFKQVSYEPDVKIRLEKFDGYWGPKPYLDAIEGSFISDPVTQVMSMKSGMGDVTHSRQAKVTNELTQAGFKVIKDFMGMVALNLNSRDQASPFYNVNVRMAAEYAINKKAIIDTLGYGYWDVADQMPVPGQNGYLSDLKPRTYDPNKAKQLLKDAGYPNGFSTKLIHAMGDFETGAVAIQADLADVGIKAEMDVIDWGKWGPMRQQGWEGIFLAGSGLISDSNAFLDSYFREGSTEMFSINRPAGFQDLIKKAVQANPADPKLTQTAMRVLFDQCLWIPVEHHGDDYNYTDKVHGLNFSTYGQWGAFDAEKVWLSK
jgi:peptide/nickel transport system substrate-binding protein